MNQPRTNVRLFIFLLLAVCLFCFCFSCNDSDDDDNSSNAGDDDDSVADVAGFKQRFHSLDDSAGIDLPRFLLRRPELTDWSSWHAETSLENPTPLRQFGGMGAGNGRVFTFLAVVDPLTTLHNLTGPHYNKHFRFFSDKTLTLAQDSLLIQWDVQKAYRVRDTAVLLTRSFKDDLTLWTVDYAPRGTDSAAKNCLIRKIIVHNRSESPASGLSLRVKSTLGKIQDGLIRESVQEDKRRLAAGFVAGVEAMPGEDRTLILPLPEIGPGDEYQCLFLLAFTQNADPVTVFDEVAGMDEDAILQGALDSWKEATAQGARVVTGNQRLDDLLEGLAQTMAVQQAEGGCFAQMSEYGYNALRDMYGIARFFPLIGRNEEYRQMLDYIWQAAIYNGNITADVSIDLQFDPQATEPDWESMPTLQGRARAEAPSYLILMHKEYIRATGDWTPLEQRYEMLRHALIHQDIRNGCLLPFSDDETFRITMMLAFGHSVTEGYEGKYLSANSSFLFVVAAQFMEELALHLGKSNDAAQYAQLADEIAQCTEDYYWLEDGYYSPILDADTLEPDIRPFEDVNTKPLWLGYLQGDNEDAQSNVQVLIDKLENQQGLLYSPIAPIYSFLGQLLGVEKGAATGMSPGYQLDNLARIDHPMAEDSFQLYDSFFHDSGNVSEGHVVDDFSRLAYLYEPLGGLCDLTARFRSWEGAIDAAALIQYLFGLKLDATKNKIVIAPHLPSGWPGAVMEEARLGDLYFDLSVEDDGQVHRVTVDSPEGIIGVDAKVSVEGTITAVRVNGDEVSPAIESQWGRSRVRINGESVGPSDSLVIEVQYEPAG